ncbi:hypothetical protein AB0J85_12300 [Micromonospora echinofusca]|uniref:hypothetical protein n=1 Tax=Micromonospora echinofusca TaxID=47858 RepID=UPI00341345D4
MTDRRVHLDDLGAWLVKGNADSSDLADRLAREPRVTSWCVRPGYRTRLMRAGQPVVLWASGSRGRLAYGVWGVGLVAAAAVPGEPGAPWSVPLDLTVLDAAHRVPRELLRADALLAGAEVLRQPQGANPSFLTAAEFAALREHLPPG